MLDVSPPAPPPARFPDCPACPYRDAGSAPLCFGCATSCGAPPRGCDSPPPHGAPVGHVCPVCGQPLTGDSLCPNTACTLDERWFSRVHTVCERPEDMWAVLWRYKYEEERTWADVLGRVLGGYLRSASADLTTYDVVTTCALYTGPRAARLWDYLRPVLDAATLVAPFLPVEHGLVVKGAPTRRFLGLGVEGRRAVAEGPLREALSVPRPERVAGRRVLVFDDVYSEGYSLREMARALRLAGALEVAGLVLTRRKGC